MGTFFPANHFAVTYNFMLVLLKKLHPELTQQKQTRVSEPKDSIKKLKPGLVVLKDTEAFLCVFDVACSTLQFCFILGFS